MNRFKITAAAVKKTKQYIKDGSGKPPPWAVRFKDDLSLAGQKLLFKDREVIPRERVEAVLREEIYRKNGDMPAGRDGAFHICKKKYVGISRRALMDFIRAQKSLGEVKAAQNKPKRSAGERLKNYVLETDLIFLKKNDLEKANQKFIRSEISDLTYFLTVTEKISGVTRFAYVKTKQANVVTPLVIKLSQEICKSLKTSTSKCDIRMDRGGEFSVEDLSKHFKKAYNVATGVSVENKNAQFQKCFFQILRQRKATTVKGAMKQAEKLMMNTYNRIHKLTSNEIIERGDEEENIKVYNRERKSFIAGDKRLPFKVGDHVRIQIKSKKPGIDYKRYGNKTYGAQVYVVKKTTKKSTPAKFYVNKKWMLQSELVKSAPRDEESNQLVEERSKEARAEELKKRKEHEKKRYAEIQEQAKPKPHGRPKRKAAKKAMLKNLGLQKRLAEADDKLDAAEEGREQQVAADEPKKSKTHEKIIKILKKYGLPTGGSLDAVQRRLKKYKKLQKKLKAKKV